MTLRRELVGGADALADQEALVDLSRELLGLEIAWSRNCRSREHDVAFSRERDDATFSREHDATFSREHDDATFSRDRGDAFS